MFLHISSICSTGKQVGINTHMYILLGICAHLCTFGRAFVSQICEHIWVVHIGPIFVHSIGGEVVRYFSNISQMYVHIGLIFVHM